MGIIAAIKVLLETLKSVGLIRDRRQEADIHTQFLATTSGPLYGLARVSIIYASAWDIWWNQGRAWAATGMVPWLELIPIIWLFIGPAIVPLAEAGLRAGLKFKADARPDKPPIVPAPTDGGSAPDRPGLGREFER